MIIYKGKLKWSKEHSRCKECGAKEVNHRQDGYCVRCWAKKRYEKEKEYRREYYKKYNKKKKKQKK